MNDRLARTSQGVEHLGLRTLDQLDVAGEPVLVHSDLSAPLDGRRIEDAWRIVAAARMIKAILDRGRIADPVTAAFPGGVDT